MDLYVAKVESNGSKLEGMKTSFNRYRKRIKNILDAPSVLIFVAILAIVDASFVVSQLIIDVLIVRQILAKNIESTRTLSGVLKETYPVDFHCFTEDHYDFGKLQDLIDYLDPDSHHGDEGYHGDGHEVHDERRRRDLHEKFKFVQDNKELSRVLRDALWNLPILHKETNKIADSTSIYSKQKAQRLKRRGSGSYNETFMDWNTTYKEESCPNVTVHHEDHKHDLEHTLAHAFHIGSLVVLTLMVFEKLLHIQAHGKKVFRERLQMFDGFVVILSWILDLALIDGIWAWAEVEAALILIIILPWRVIRIVNCFVMTFKERYKIHIRIIQKQAKASEKKARVATSKMARVEREILQLRDLAADHGASDEAIESCKHTDTINEKTGKYFKIMSRMANILMTSLQVRKGEDPETTEISPETGIRRCLSAVELEEIQHDLRECSIAVETRFAHLDETKVRPLETIELPLETMVHSGETQKQPVITVAQPVEKKSPPVYTMVHDGETTVNPVYTVVHSSKETSHPLDPMLLPRKSPTRPVRKPVDYESFSGQPSFTIVHSGQRAGNSPKRRTQVRFDDFDAPPSYDDLQSTEMTGHPVDTVVQSVKPEGVAINELKKSGHTTEEHPKPSKQMTGDTRQMTKRAIFTIEAEDTTGHPEETRIKSVEKSEQTEGTGAHSRQKAETHVDPFEESKVKTEHIVGTGKESVPAKGHHVDKGEEFGQETGTMKDSGQIKRHPLAAVQGSGQNTIHSVAEGDESGHETGYHVETGDAGENMGHPVGKIEGPKQNTSQPVETSGHPIDKTVPSLDRIGHPVDKREQSLERTGHPVDKAEQSGGVAGHPVDQGNQYVDLTGHPVDKGERSGDVTRHPLNKGKQSGNITGHSVDLTRHPLDRGKQSGDMKGHSVDVTGHPIDKGKQSGDVTGHPSNTIPQSPQPIDATERSNEHQKPPANIAVNPGEALTWL